MTRRRLLAAAGAGAAAFTFLGDLVTPGPATAPLPSRGSAPVAVILPQLAPRNVGRYGKPGDPLNLVFVGTEAQVVGALEEAGWTRIPLRIPAAFRAGLAELLHGKRLGAFPPMNLYRLDGRPQDLNWSQPITPITKRHHFRLWRSGWTDERGREVWWGTGNFDLDVRWWDLSHTPDPDMDAERDMIAGTLKGSRWVASLELRPAPQVPREGANDKGYAFRTDGRVLVATLTDPG
ncbi:MAG: LssY C-terminal domain-containing protein [Elusimicrobia bacterium]|nr:LssY C-terminal domain-containing protein [Elusimicrobiota bacterium]